MCAALLPTHAFTSLHENAADCERPHRLAAPKGPVLLITGGFLSAGCRPVAVGGGLSVYSGRLDGAAIFPALSPFGIGATAPQCRGQRQS